MDRKHIRIGSRESRLAVVQSEIIIDAIKLVAPEAHIELVTMKTTGDMVLDQSLELVGGKGLFIKELDAALMDKRCDLSVHSLKDMPMEVPAVLPILTYSEREDVRDVLVLKKGLKELPDNPVIGTYSKRRTLQAAALYPGAVFKGIRGNLVTRLRKLDDGEYDALILAAAGMIRMGFADRINRYFSIDEIIPPAGQGILAVQGRREPGWEFLEAINSPVSEAMALAERSFVRTLDGGCSSPVAACAEITGDRLKITGLYYNEVSGRYRKGILTGSVKEAEILGEGLARSLKKQDREGKVWLLGAGPGDAGLLTIKGKQVLDNAQVVIYDALVGEGVLAWIPDGAKQIDVGKRSGLHGKTQQEINQILIEEGKTGKQVVRLKGGDPFVFGRGSEEAGVLTEHGIPFEVIPGITSATAVPAYCGIPVTHRGTAASFHVITGHSKEDKPAVIDYDALVRIGGTLIFLMGLSSTETICDGLLKAGMDADTPAALLQEGTTANQKKVISVLKDLTADGKAAGIKAPAIILIGEVCSLEESCRWVEEKPLFGNRILVTRPSRRAGLMAEKLRTAGAEVLELPAIETNLITDNLPLKTALSSISSFDWLAFTSPNGVELFFEYLREQQIDIRLLSDRKIAVIGSGTADMLERHGIYADYMPRRFYASELGAGLGAQMKKNESLLILRAREGSKELLHPLDEKNIKYKDVALYETKYPSESSKTLRIKKQLKEKQFHFVTFTSGSTVEGFMNTLHPGKEELSGFTAVCIGEQTAKSAERYGMTYVTSRIPAIDSMVECIIGSDTLQCLFNIIQ